MILKNESYYHHHNESVQQFYIDVENDIQSIFMLLWELSLVISVVWLIFKKTSHNDNVNFSKSEEERIIKVYKPETLVEEVSAYHHALNPLVVQGKIGMYINVKGTECINFATHDYLGLIGNHDIEAEVLDCISTFGVGSCGPRAFYGTSIKHLELEQLLADIFNAESSLVYSYGFATLSSAIPAYAKKTDIIFVDEKRNFAIQKGLQASGSDIKFFKHNDPKDLERILENQRKLDLLNKREARRIRRYLVIEGIYVNTGKVCPLPELLELCKKYKVRILVDESVSFGTLGPTGKGVTEYYGIPLADIDLIMGSFEYSLASVGGYCIGSRLLIDHQQISGQGYCFSASLPSLLATAVIKALYVIQNNTNKLKQFNKLCKFMHIKLNDSVTINSYFTVTGDADSPIHVLTMKNQMLFPQSGVDNFIGAFLTFGISHKIIFSRAVSLKEDTTMTKGAIRITTHLFNSEDQILYLIQVLEESCRICLGPITELICNTYH